jgi:hypothetical protein
LHNRLSSEAPAKLHETVTPGASPGPENLENPDSRFRSDDVERLLQEAIRYPQYSKPFFPDTDVAHLTGFRPETNIF